jgi:phage protein D
VATVTLGESSVLRWSFARRSDSVHGKCKVQYQDPKAGKWKGTSICEEKDPDVKTGRTLKINERVESEAQARGLAKRRLKQANRAEWTGSLTILGDPALLGGTTIKLSGFGAFDGIWFIDKAEHQISGGYVTSLEIHRGSAASKSTRPRKRKGGVKKKKLGTWEGKDIFE